MDNLHYLLYHPVNRLNQPTTATTPSGESKGNFQTPSLCATIFALTLVLNKSWTFLLMTIKTVVNIPELKFWSKLDVCEAFSPWTSGTRWAHSSRLDLESLRGGQSYFQPPKYYLPALVIVEPAKVGAHRVITNSQICCLPLLVRNKYYLLGEIFIK